MIDKFGRRLQSIVLGGIVVLLSAVFVLEFGGPQSEGCASSLASASYAANVYGEDISEGDFRAAYTLAGFNRHPLESAKQGKLKELTLEGLIERNLLAREAAELGFEVTEDEIMQRLAREGTIYVSASVHAPPTFPSGEIPVPVKDEEGAFDKESARRFIQYHLRRSIGEFGEAQIKETLAHRMRELIKASVEVSPEEVWATYQEENDKVTLEYLRFSPTYFSETLSPSDSEIQAWMKQRSADIDKAFNEQKHRYTGLGQQVRARHILIKTSPDAPEEETKAQEAKAQRLLQRARSGGDFASLARQFSEDTASARKGGDLGYNPKGRMVPEFDQAQFATKPGEISDLVKSQYGYHIIKVEGSRQGDVPIEEAKREIAEQLYRQEQASKLASSAAAAALEKIKQGASLEAASPVAASKTKDEPEEDSLAPVPQETQPFGRRGVPIPGPYDSGALAKIAFALEESKPVADKPIRLGDDWFVIKLKTRTRPSRDAMQAEAEAIRERLVASKQQQAIIEHVHQLREQAASSNSLSINKAVLSYDATNEQS